MNTKEILQKARELISNPKAWTKGNYAKDAEGENANETSERAVCFCSLGAVYRITDGPNDIAWKARTALGYALPTGFYFVPEFNDDPKTTHADVLALFDRAIAACE